MKSRESKFHKITFGALAISVGFVAGYFTFDNSAELREMRALISQLQIESAKNVKLATAARSFTPPSLVPTPNVPATNASLISSSGMDDLFKNITEEDMAITKAMNKREEAGEYILEFERPSNRKLMQEGIKKSASRRALEAAPEVRQIYNKVGIKPEMAQQLELHQEKIKLASLEAEQAIGQLNLARQEYDKRIQSLLTEEEYVKYRQLEETRAATREYSLLRDYANEYHISMDPAMETKLTDIINSAKAHTELSWHNPYDGLPQPEVGINSCKLEQQEIQRIKEASARVKSKASEMGLHEGYINLLDAYYRDKINRREVGLQRSLDRMGYVLEP